MAIGLDGHSKGTGTGTPSTPFTLNHACGGVQRLLAVVFTGIRNSTSSWSVSGVTYNGSALTQAAANERSGSSRNVRTEVWYLVNPPGGSSYQVSVTSSTGLLAYSLAAISLTGVDQTTPVGSAGTDAGQKTSFSVGVTTGVANAWLVGGAGARYAGGAWSPQGSTVEVYEQASGTNNTSDVTACGDYLVCTSAGSYSLAANLGSTEHGVMGAMAVQPAASAAVDWVDSGLVVVAGGGVWAF